MRVAVISLILACIAGLAAFFILEKVETPQKQAELSVSQPATGLVPVAPPVKQEAEKAPFPRPSLPRHRLLRRRHRKMRLQRRFQL